MIPLQVHLDGDGCWPDLKTREFLHGVIEGAAYLENGTAEGNPTVSLRCVLDSGTIVVVETTLRLFLTASATLLVKAKRDKIDCWQGPPTTKEQVVAWLRAHRLHYEAAKVDQRSDE